MKMQLGVAAGPLPVDAEQLTLSVAKELAALGVTAVVTHFNPHPDVMSLEEAHRIGGVLADQGIRIVQAGGFRASLVDPDDTRREAGLRELQRVLPLVKAMGAEMFITGCGSLNPESFYGPHPENHAPRTQERLVKSLNTVKHWAEGTDVIFALECHLLTTLDTPRTIRDVLDAVDSTHVLANFDPVNMLGDLPSVYNSARSMTAMIDTVGPHYAKCGHAKDVTVDVAYPLHLTEAGPGEGHLDFGGFFAACSRLGEGTAVIVEHLPADRAVQALDYVKNAAAEAGVTFV